ncbi:hypothetical protein WAH39_18675, partial [Acinetobacter baumannii]
MSKAKETPHSGRKEKQAAKETEPDDADTIDALKDLDHEASDDEEDLLVDNLNEAPASEDDEGDATIPDVEHDRGNPSKAHERRPVKERLYEGTTPATKSKPRREGMDVLTHDQRQIYWAFKVDKGAQIKYLISQG